MLASWLWSHCFTQSLYFLGVKKDFLPSLCLVVRYRLLKNGKQEFRRFVRHHDADLFEYLLFFRLLLNSENEGSIVVGEPNSDRTRWDVFKIRGSKIAWHKLAHALCNWT